MVMVVVRPNYGRTPEKHLGRRVECPFVSVARHTLQVDTGASISLFSLSFAKNLFKGERMRKTTTKLYGVVGTPLDVVGALPAL